MDIVEFISHRFDEARESLRDRVDSKTFQDLENEFKLNLIGLVAPTRRLGEFDWPPLPKAWHGLFEECTELTIAWDSLTTALRLLGPPEDQQEPIASGREATYHFRSWFVLSKTVSEKLQSVITKWIDLRFKRSSASTQLKAKYKTRVSAEIGQYVATQRNNYLHGGNQSWGSGITEVGLWEGGVFVGLTPELLLAKDVYPRQSGRRERDYRILEAATDGFQSRIAEILQDLEEEVTASDGSS